VKLFNQPNIAMNLAINNFKVYVHLCLFPLWERNLTLRAQN